MDLSMSVTEARSEPELIAAGAALGGAAGPLSAAEEALPTDLHRQLRTAIVKRWKMVVHVCVMLLILTGSFNFYVAFRDGVKPMPYHALFGVKVILAFVVFFYAIALTGSSPGFAALRENGRKWMGVQIAIAIVVILLSGVLKTIHQAAVAAGSS